MYMYVYIQEDVINKKDLKNKIKLTYKKKNKKDKIKKKIIKIEY